jgi:hypothetical protein
MSALRRLGRALAIELGPLRRHRDFRLLFVGQGVSLAGSMITYVAIPFQVYELTGYARDGARRDARLGDERALLDRLRRPRVRRRHGDPLRTLAALLAL